MLRGTAPERPDGKSVRVMLDAVAARRKRRRWFVAQGVAAAAAGIVAVTAVVTTLVVRGDGSNQAGPQNPTTSTSQTRVANNSTEATMEVKQQDPNSGVFTKITASDEAWGTSMDIEISGMSGPGRG